MNCGSRTIRYTTSKTANEQHIATCCYINSPNIDYKLNFGKFNFINNILFFSLSFRSSCTLEDSTYSSTSEGEELDSDRETVDDRDENDPNKLLGTWLGQLQLLEQVSFCTQFSIIFCPNLGMLLFMIR